MKLPHPLIEGRLVRRYQRFMADVELDDGRLFVGEVSITLPDASARLQDFLNSTARFFEVRSERAFHFVNRDRIVMVKATG